MYHPASFVMLEVGTLHCPIPPMVNVISETCLPLVPVPSRGVYTYPYIHPPLVLSPPMVQDKVNSGMLFTQSLPVQSFDYPKEQERKKVEFIIQPKNTETQQKVNLIEERLNAIEGIAQSREWMPLN